MTASWLSVCPSPPPAYCRIAEKAVCFHGRTGRTELLDSHSPALSETPPSSPPLDVKRPLEAAKALAAASWTAVAESLVVDSESEEEEVENHRCAGMAHRSSPPWKWRPAEFGSKRISTAPHRLSPPHHQVTVNQPHGIGRGIGLSANQRSFSEAQRQYLLQHFQFRCADPFGKCQLEKGRLLKHTLPHGEIGWVGELDHIIEWSDGGRTTLSNLQLLCPMCHFIKTKQAIGARCQQSVRGVRCPEKRCQRERTAAEAAAVRDVPRMPKGDPSQLMRPDIKIL